jgi:SAM-dependent methyltransferase
MIEMLVKLKTALVHYGVRRTLSIIWRRLIDVCSDAWFDRWYGVETAKRMRLETLAISGDNKTHGRWYSPTSRRRLRALFRALALPSHSLGFLDYGCGKGRVLMEAADAGFKRVEGVEFSPELCDIARTNVAHFEKRRRNPSSIKVVQADAALYDPPADMGVFYFFNPFDEFVFRTVVDRILESLRRCPREAWLIYHFTPEFGGVIDGVPDFLLEQEIIVAGLQFSVYRYIQGRNELLWTHCAVTRFL